MRSPAANPRFHGANMFGVIAIVCAKHARESAGRPDRASSVSWRDALSWSQRRTCARFAVRACAICGGVDTGVGPSSGEICSGSIAATLIAEYGLSFARGGLVERQQLDEPEAHRTREVAHRQHPTKVATPDIMSGVEREERDYSCGDAANHQVIEYR